MGGGIEQLARKVLRRLRPHWMLNALALKLPDVETFAAPRLIELPAGSRLLVLAPHPDDESIGCGGTLAKWRDAGRMAKVLFLTDGRQGSRALRSMPGGDPSRAKAQDALIDARQREAHRALRALGIEDFVFANVPDGELRKHVDAIAQTIAELIDHDQPDLIMLPFLTDRHPDHAAAGACLLSGLRRLGRDRLLGLSCAGYEVWSPIYANSVVDISGWIERKTAAIAAYESQLRDTNYVEGALSLNRYRAISSLVPGSHAEAFYIAPAATYLALAERLTL